MTTQLAVFNLYGVAVASDTLASLKTDNGFKYSFGNSKIWAPQSGHQFVVYHSGAAAFNSMPHQVHVESWFRTLTKPLPTLNDYAESYKKFCASAASTHSPASEAALIEAMFEEVIKVLRKNIDEFADPSNKDEWNKVLIEQASDALEYYNSLNNFPKTSVTWAEEAIALHKFNVRKELKRALPEGFPPKFFTLFNKAFKKFLASTAYTGSDSNLTFVGYGDKDLYPAARKIEFRGILKGRVLYRTGLSQTLEPVINTTGLQYGAQNDAMWGFVQGFRAPVRNQLNDILMNHFPEAEDKQDKIDTVIQDLTIATDKEYVNPFFRRLSNCSVKELAETSRDMLNIQILSAKLSGSQETVGGDVELLTIDKVNGVRWLNRI